MQIHTPTVVQGVFYIRCRVSKRFCLQWKAFDLLYMMRHILWMVVLLEACDVNNGRHLYFTKNKKSG